RPGRPVSFSSLRMRTMPSGSSRRARSIASGGGFGRPARWISTCRMVIHCLGRTANSGMYSHTGSSRRITSPWSRRWITIAVTALAAEKMLNGVAGVARTFGASGGSSGPLPRAWPMARSIRACPCRRTQRWFAGWLTGELALHHLAWQLVMTVVFAWAGALRAWPGWMGLAVTLLSWSGLVGCLVVARRAEAVVEQALVAGLGPRYAEEIRTEPRGPLAPAIDWRRVLVPFPIRHPQVERVRDIVYARVAGRVLRLDVYRHRDHPTGCPTLLQ